MEIIQNGESLSCKNVLALGDFDGVHLGHRKLLETTVQIAGHSGARSGVYTFRVNTKKLLGTENFSLLTTETEKNEIFASFGFDFVCADDFNAVKDFSPEQFASYLAGRFSPTDAVCGENFTFGKNASAGSETLARLLAAYGCKTHIVTSVEIGGVCVSSTRVRNLIAAGDMPMARRLLGYPYFIRTKVVHGARLGRKLGFPTINQLEYSGKAIPKFGVYACVCKIGDKVCRGVVNVGVRPTVSEKEKDPPVVFETHILDFNEDLYGKDITVEFYKMLRPEKKFGSLEELRENVLKNIEETRVYFSQMPETGEGACC